MERNSNYYQTFSASEGREVDSNWIHLHIVNLQSWRADGHPGEICKAPGHQFWHTRVCYISYPSPVYHPAQLMFSFWFPKMKIVLGYLFLRTKCIVSLWRHPYYIVQKWFIDISYMLTLCTYQRLNITIKLNMCIPHWKFWM